MTQLATLSLKNQAGTEVDFAVNGVDYSNNVASWSAAGDTYDLKPIATFSIVPPKSKTTRARVRLKVTVPVISAVDLTTKVDEIIGSVEFVLPKTSALASRQNLRAYLADFLTDAVVKNAIENFEGVY